uniref:Uncharacterized protein n=1 Tax=Siphoviridae sp. ctsxw88 TaxID=2825701 RepID=A0A8S5PHE2_9CAUD|nr:MAG TPA: hypothetical protein [Siphoviridae sp. ctsxw88]
MYRLPISVTVGEKVYNIREKGDYRVVLDMIAALNDKELSDNERLISSLIVFYEDFESVEDVLYCADTPTLYQEMLKFTEAGDNSGHKTNHKLIDWEQDEQLITAAINPIAQQEIRLIPYLHWWTFIGYYMSIGECSLSYVVGIREKMYKGKKLEKDEREFMHNNPNYFTFINSREEQEDLLKSIWNVDKNENEV